MSGGDGSSSLYFAKWTDANCAVHARSEAPVAVLFYGLFRTLSNTFPGIESHVLGPLRARGDVDVLVHSMYADNVVATHGSDDSTSLAGWPAPEIERLLPCAYAISTQSVVDKERNLSALINATFKVSPRISDYNDYPTMMNIYRSRFSLWQAGLLMERREERLGIRYAQAVVVRPDTAFLAPVQWNALVPGRTALLVPNYAHWGGVCDRFAYGDRDSVAWYTQEWLELASRPYPDFGGSEGVLCEHLKAARSPNVSVGVLPVCVVRVRADGRTPLEDYTVPRALPNCAGLARLADFANLSNSCPPAPANAYELVPPVSVAWIIVGVSCALSFVGMIIFLVWTLRESIFRSGGGGGAGDAGAPKPDESTPLDPKPKG